MQAGWSPQHIAAVSYGIAAAAFLLLGLLLLRGWRARRHATALLAACALTVLWAAGAARHGASGGALMDALEIAHSGAWALFLLLLLEATRRRLCRWLAVYAAAALLPALAAPWAGASYALAAGLPAMPPAALPAALASQAALAAIAPRLALALCGILLVEQLYRGTPPRQRWGIKFACLGIGAMYAYDFYLYSDALLLRHVTAAIWSARGVVDALAAPLIAVSAARNPAWALGLTVSRQMKLRSAALIGAALYLLAMAASAWYLRAIGGAWGPVMLLDCLCGAAMLLAGVLFSGAVRARVKVFINKNFYQGSYDYRQEWLRLTRALSADGPALAERSIQAVAALVESPAGALWLRRERGVYEPVASWNMAPLPTRENGDAALCRFMQARQWVIDVADCRARPQRYGQLQLPAWLETVPRLWLLVPLMLHGGLAGFIALTRPRAPIALDWEVRDLLKIAASQAASYLAHQESANSLLVARQFESFNRMSAFIVHDVKNLVSQLSLLLQNADRHHASAAFQQDLMDTLAHSVAKMTQLLHKLGRADATAAAQTAQALDLAPLLARAVLARAGSTPQPSLGIDAAGLTVRADAQRLERVLGHLLQNAIEATARDGTVSVRLLREGAAAVIELRDSGEGMSAGFIRERLFQPFDTTKPAGMGIGVFESREYVRELGGRLEVSSAPRVGTTFRVILPLHDGGTAT
ncbi:XrtA/PEP-CTERM system histidine kinase PrsK [Rugamonas sp.]|uniref:XrtA/PEP-CTERM system histidine kinase PrsK n=1 Tax=Rugamonas sp. TaxID=1926287 RepID=UPI0025D6953A|nr:XrtA/PEP-CTERM system histidine kinase PrsK [Rugamonas sp.]